MSTAPPTTAPADNRRWFVLVLVCIAQFMVVLDAHHHQRRPAIDPDRPRLLTHLAAVGGQRLHAGVRWIPAARRTRRRLRRPPPPVRARHHRLHRGLAGLRSGAVVRVPHLRPRPPGPRRSDGLPGRAVDRDHHLPRGPRAHQGAQRVGRDRRRRRRRRPAARRHPHRVPVVGVGVLRQRAGRRAGDPAVPSVHPGVEGHRHEGRRRARRDQRHRRHHAARLHHRQDPGLRLALGRDDQHVHRLGDPADRLRVHRAALEGAARAPQHLQGSAR